MVWYFVLTRLVHSGCWWFGILYWNAWCTVVADGLVFCTETPGAQWLLMGWYFVLARQVHRGCWWFGILYWHAWCTVGLVHSGCWWYGGLVFCADTPGAYADRMVFCTGTPGAQWLLMGRFPVWTYSACNQAVHDSIRHLCFFQPLEGIGLNIASITLLYSSCLK